MENISLLKSNIEELLRVDGILSKGYGLIPKELTLDPRLTIEAKAIFSFISCHTGGGESAFPKRETILKALGISKDRYYRHFSKLIELGYIKVSQERKSHGKFSVNVYTLNYNLDKGFGFIPRLIMYDERIKIGEKGLYALYLSFAGAGQDSLISLKKDDILYFLGISNNTFVKYNKSLITLNLIASTRKHEGGKFSESEVRIVLNPDEKEVLSSIQYKIISNQDTKNKDTAQETNIKDTVNQDTNFEDAAIYINNNNLKNNKKLNNNKEKGAHEFNSVFGSLTLSQEEHEILSGLFENINGLYERAILALAQRNVMPKSIFHFVAEIAKKEKWPEKKGVSESASSAKKEQEDRELLLDQEYEKELEKKRIDEINRIMKEENVSFDEAEKIYQENIKKKLKTFFR